ncbi:hypothetical protein IFM46972_01676, partial [Aspergillus udagawae]
IVVRDTLSVSCPCLVFTTPPSLLLPAVVQGGVVMMNEVSGVVEIRKSQAMNVCKLCRSQKRKCDKRLPNCTRCEKLELKCNYDWSPGEDQAGHQYKSLSGFLLFHVPVVSGQQWLPGTFLPEQSYRQNIDFQSLAIDRFFVELVMTALSERSVSVDAILRVYFRNIHRWLPAIPEQKFRARISQIHSSHSAELVLLLLARYLLMENEWDDSSNQRESQQHLYQHCSYLVSFLLLVRGPSLELVQAGLLLILYELGSGFLEAAFLRAATCARLAYILGLHVDESFVDDCSDSNLMQLMQRLFEQSVGWEAYLGATAIALMAALTLHRSQVGYGAPSVIAQPPDILHRTPLSMAALSSVITMVRDICLQLNALKTREEIARVPLPAVMCIGETALTAVWLKQADPDESHVDSLPFKLALGRVRHYWILAGIGYKSLR